MRQKLPLVSCIVRMSCMRIVHLQSLDLNLLVHLRALLEERNVTAAAKRNFLSQPAMSRVLERLRGMFKDPLLVRSGGTYQRTVRADRLLRELETVLPRLEAMVRGEEFDPARSEERFRVALTDHAATVLLPSLVQAIRKGAPRIKLEVSVWRARAYEDVAAGRIDAALSAEEVPPALQSEIIFNLDFVCIVGSALRMRAHRFTLKRYLQFPHARVETLAGLQTLVDRPLAQLGVKRNVVLTIPFFVPAIYAMARSDLVLTVPRKLAKITRGITGVKVVEPPRELKAFPYFMAWHSRLTGEPAHSWFREQIRQAVASS
jgi:DNA-binding transcriptional LysR family regulator